MQEIIIKPVAFVENLRRTLEDDDWGGVFSKIKLIEEIPASAFDEINAFSHLEILYYFDRVDPDKVVIGSEHPRENPAWPKVGIFAQRKKNRPNLIGCTIVKLFNRIGDFIIVEGLDAVDGAPVLDIKPVYQEFLPTEKVHQPVWSTELMKDYWYKNSGLE